MVLCKFFQQGSCRFGAKCHNEHFDVRQLVKSDVESAVNGKQWPISCYGPFKDKCSIPNFIEDQCFEEIRFLCYEAKKNNFFDQFSQQFTKEVLEATNKMKALLHLTPEIVDVVSQVYDSPDTSVTVGAAPPSNSNNNSNNPFAKATGAPTNALFGSAAAPAPTSGGIFGAGGGGIGAFANPTGNSGAGSIFGGGTTPGNSNIGGGIFGGAQPAPAAQQTSLFGQQAAANPIFGATQSNIFGQPQQQQHQQQQQQQTTAPAGGLFAQAAQQLNPPAAGGGLFAQAAQQMQQSNPSGFGLFSQAAQQTAPAVGQTAAVFGGQPQQQPAAGAGLFGQTHAQPPGPPGGIFAQAAATGGMFATSAAQTPNLFGQALPQAASAGFFAQAMHQPGPPPVQQQLPAALNVPASATTYSRMEDLSADEIEAFKADAFVAGKLPFSPPPRELVQ